VQNYALEGTTYKALIASGTGAVLVPFPTMVVFTQMPEALRIPVQSCHLFQTNTATHSISKLPLIPVNVATLWW
jgi:hypothetical protein